MKKSYGYRAIPPRSVLVRNDYELPDLASDQMYVDVLTCGVCHSDLHVIDGHFSKDPNRVAGHEVVGTVKEKGKDVTDFEIGQLVGIGWQSGSCGTCAQCLSGNENECAQEQATCLQSHPNGGFSGSLISNQKFTYAVPANMKAAEVSPLLCAGVTVYSPLKRFGLSYSQRQSPQLASNARVGVLGIGGLGHLAIQFAAKMGYEVVAVSNTASKEQEARNFGATSFLSYDQLDSQKDSLDFILSTVPQNIDWGKCHDALRIGGEMCQAGIILDSPSYASVFGSSQKQLTSARTGSPAMIREMLDFASKHNVRPVIEEYSFGRINIVLENLRENKIRYRAVMYRDML